MVIVSFVALSMLVINGVLLALSQVSKAFDALPPLDNALSWLTTSLTYLSGVFNIDALCNAFIFLLSFTAGMIMWKLFFILIRWIPFIGSYIRDPLAMLNDELSSHASSSNSVELDDDFAERHGYVSRGGFRYTRNIPESEVRRWYR